MARPNRKLLNLALLIGGFGLGQGSIFIVQTVLVAEGRLDLLAAFGLHFSFAILGLLLVDWGSLTVLARETAMATAGEMDRDGVWRAWWAMAPSRLVIALVVIASGLVYAQSSGPGFGATFVLAALPAALIWSLNANGILDGLKLSGVSGVTGSLPYLGTATALFFTRSWSPEAAGTIVGLALSASYLTTIALQQVAIARAGYGFRLIRPSGSLIWTMTQQGFAACLSLLPGQLYFRLQLALSASVLGTDLTAIFIYAKQVIVAVAQLIGFLRRIEFPDLVAALKVPSDNVVGRILRAQRLGTGVAFVATLIFACGGIAVASLLQSDLGRAGGAVALFSPVVLTSALGLCLQQGMFALGMFHRAASLRVATTLVGGLLSAALIAPLGLTGFMIADTAIDLLFVAAAVWILSRHASSRLELAK